MSPKVYRLYRTSFNAAVGHCKKFLFSYMRTIKTWSAEPGTGTFPIFPVVLQSYKSTFL